jgi:predicted pyridoxine 5'-phosphate oxidase superfamily flavin-nucleotide-binding protein
MAKKHRLAALDEHCLKWIAHSPLVMFMTCNSNGDCNVSPRGGLPGFVKALDDKHVVLADPDSEGDPEGAENLTHNNGVGLSFLIPNVIEVMQIAGRATVTSDPKITALLSSDGAMPSTAIVLEIHDIQVQCGKALRRSEIWNSEKWVSGPTPSSEIY